MALCLVSTRQEGRGVCKGKQVIKKRTQCLEIDMIKLIMMIKLKKKNIFVKTEVGNEDKKEKNTKKCKNKTFLFMSRDTQYLRMFTSTDSFS